MTEHAQPRHHDPDGGFRNPWTPRRDRSLVPLLRWMWARWRDGIPPNPKPADLPRGISRVAHPRSRPGEIRITWVGHATALIQLGGLNILTDPHWSQRAAPLQWVGPARFVPPGIAFDALPPIDAVLLSHDHYDHLDEGTVRRLARQFGGATRWYTPIGYRDWLARRGVTNVVELDWWAAAELTVFGGPSAVVTALPAQHWTKRGVNDPERLWASWSVRAASGESMYFGGDSGYSPGFREIGERCGRFDAALLPIGAYDPRWFMQHDHMNPEEAVRAYRDLGGSGDFVGIHWGTFRLTDEDPLEPPRRARAAWEAAGLPADSLWIPRHGETRIVRQVSRRTA